jgi:hypothetical protein
VKKSPVKVSCAIGVEFVASNNNLVAQFYMGSLNLPTTSLNSLDHGILMVLEISPSIAEQDMLQKGYEGSARDSRKRSKLFRELLSAAQNFEMSIIREAIVPATCQDREAASVIALQHFCYQSRVFGSVLCQEKLHRSGIKRKLCT